MRFHQSLTSTTTRPLWKEIGRPKCRIYTPQCFATIYHFSAIQISNRRVCTTSIHKSFSTKWQTKLVKSYKKAMFSLKSVETLKAPFSVQSVVPFSARVLLPVSAETCLQLDGPSEILLATKLCRQLHHLWMEFSVEERTIVNPTTRRTNSFTLIHQRKYQGGEENHNHELFCRIHCSVFRKVDGDLIFLVTVRSSGLIQCLWLV